MPNDLQLLNAVLDFLLTKGEFWLTTDGNALVCAFGEYIKEKGEAWRIGEGCEITDKYQALMEILDGNSCNQGPGTARR